MKTYKGMQQQQNQRSFLANPFTLLSDEIIFAILDFLGLDPFSRKSFSLVCKSFFSIESRHRKTLKLLSSDFLSRILLRYPAIDHLDLSICPVNEADSWDVISSLCNSALRSIKLSPSMFFANAGFSKLVMNCSALVAIDLSNVTEFTDSGAVAIAEAKNLERLWLVRCKLVSDIGIGCIAVGCRKLRLINLKWCLRVSDLGVGLIALKCKEIRCLDLSYLPITKRCLPTILQLQHLEDLVLVGCFSIDFDGLTNLKRGCKSLEVLNMSNCPCLSHVGLSFITTSADCLRELNISYGPPVTFDMAKCLQYFSKLQSIRLDGCIVTCSGMKAIGNWCSSLNELSLSKCSGVTDEGLCSIVQRHQELRKLDITCCRKITLVSINSITKSCAHLTSLRMESCSLVQSEAFVLVGQHCQYLEELDATDNEVDDEGLKSIERCSRLSSLKLGICLNITDVGISHIGAGCPKLTEIDLYRCIHITDVGVAAIARGCPDLETINTAYCDQVTNTSLESLSKCLKLKALEIRGCPGVSSIGISAIAQGCRQLTMLDIKKCHNIKDIGMLPLAQFSQNLKQINLSYCSVTDVGLLALATISSLQNITMLHLTGLTSNGLAAALWECRGLMKVKLHLFFKRLLPHSLLDHMQSRGCVFQWRNKPTAQVRFQIFIFPCQAKDTQLRVISGREESHLYTPLYQMKRRSIRSPPAKNQIWVETHPMEWKLLLR